MATVEFLYGSTGHGLTKEETTANLTVMKRYIDGGNIPRLKQQAMLSMMKLIGTEEEALYRTRSCWKRWEILAVSKIIHKTAIVGNVAKSIRDLLYHATLSNTSPFSLRLYLLLARPEHQSLSIIGHVTEGPVGWRQ